MNLNQYTHIYLIGVGGIGMSALARFFLNKKYKVYGYDAVKSDLCQELEKEGVNIHYDNNIFSIPKELKLLKENKLLVIYTPAISLNQNIIKYFIDKDFKVYKRSKILGFISQKYFTIAIAGTHGKTTTTSILTFILKNSEKKVISFIGGITNNYNSNLVMDENANIFIVEADEYDKSFLELSPNIAVVTSIDSDHLDLYKNKNNLYKSYLDFAKRVKEKGIILIESSINLNFSKPKRGFIKKYSANEISDYYANNLNVCSAKVFANLFVKSSPKNYNCIAKRAEFTLPGKHNVSNMVAAVAVALMLKVNIDTILKSLKTFKGIRRRFEFVVNKKNLVFIDDYAHHPSEISSTIKTVRLLFPDRNLTVIFQPHLYSRTKDFAIDFARVLSMADRLILLDIYPAREKPISGVNSKMMLGLCTNIDKQVCEKENLLSLINKIDIDILLTMGAGDISELTEPIKHILN
ncbi:MAG: UDP-N-acetylmuramate--L-alanine ligase [Flavobacteriales bacterium]|nr:UDP-N-acetylmuramate--L-alanine ligase [Flavobacteriales bacterium]|tara:strand:- start:4792 stop:6186 length:1395 start_codon:yes stop_codon:yes gene_type:complete